MYEARGLAFLSLLAVANSYVLPIPVVIGLESSDSPQSRLTANTGASGLNIQTFRSFLGGLDAPAVVFDVSAADHPYSVGTSTYNDAASALQASCATQHGICISTCHGIFTKCDAQQEACDLAATTIAADYDTAGELKKRDGGKFKPFSERAVVPGGTFETNPEKRDGGKFKLPNSKRAMIPGGSFEANPEKRDGGKFKLPNAERAVVPGGTFKANPEKRDGGRINRLPPASEKRDGGKFKFPAAPVKRAVVVGSKFEAAPVRRDGGKFRGLNV